MDTERNTGRDYVSWTRMEDGTREDWLLLDRIEREMHTDLVDRTLAHLKLLDTDHGGYRITRYRHSLQAATLAHRDGAGEEMVVAALLHDIGDVLSPCNHSAMAAALLQPYVSERVYQVVKHHGLFQGYYFSHHLGGDRDARDRYRHCDWYADCVYFCANYDQNAFDPDYDDLPLEFFIPMLRRVMAQSRFGHLDLASPAV